MTGPPRHRTPRRPINKRGRSGLEHRSVPGRRPRRSGRRDAMSSRPGDESVLVVRVVTVLAGVVCLALGAVSGVALVVGLGALTAPAMVVVAVTTTGFLAAGGVLVARARSPRPEKSVAGIARHRNSSDHGSRARR